MINSYNSAFRLPSSKEFFLFPHHVFSFLWQGVHACWVTQSCWFLCDPVDFSQSGSSVHGILQARILEWVAISFSRESSRLRDRTWVSGISCIDRRILYPWAMWETLSDKAKHIYFQAWKSFSSHIFLILSITTQTRWASKDPAIRG